jgi:hypothetical protein
MNAKLASPEVRAAARSRLNLLEVPSYVSCPLIFLFLRVLFLWRSFTLLMQILFVSIHISFSLSKYADF